MKQKCRHCLLFWGITLEDRIAVGTNADKRHILAVVDQYDALFFHSDEELNDLQVLQQVKQLIPNNRPPGLLQEYSQVMERVSERQRKYSKLPKNKLVSFYMLV